ncbi:TAP-like protein-domain-containing protein [Mycena floridula]|nr:TAP-like protein-domain-containing protein [Mycena floridula]
MSEVEVPLLARGEEYEAQLEPLTVHKSRYQIQRYWRKGLLLCLSIFLVGLFYYRWHSSSKTSYLRWEPCPEASKYLCAFLKVPTDYNNSSAGTVTLALSKYPTTASAAERLGSVMTNFGGPGLPGRTALFESGARLQALFGNKYDIIAWDQRGLGKSLPKINCFGSGAGYERFLGNTVLESTFSIPSNPFSTTGRALMVQQQRQALALEKAQANMCRIHVGSETLRYMSTSMTIRDMGEINRVLEGPDAKINFAMGWCACFLALFLHDPNPSHFIQSYGTIVGSYLANMLPHKVGRILIDGVVPPDMWANIHYESMALPRLFLRDAESTYDWFLSECFKAGSPRCALVNAQDRSASDIKKRISSFLLKLESEPLVVTGYEDRAGILTDGGVRILLYKTIQNPPRWPEFARYLASAMQGDGSDVRRFMARSPANYTQQALGRLAISCGDALPYSSNETTWPTAENIVDRLLGIMKDVSPTFGGTVHIMEQHGACQFWPATGMGPERFTGPWNHSLTTPMLILSNTDDPVTPLEAGRIVKRDLGSSARLVVQQSPGHSYLAPMTRCARNIITDYFVQGKIPVNDETRCGEEAFDYFPS